jgi:membrane protease YdiL (CAAX protease family)
VSISLPRVPPRPDRGVFAIPLTLVETRPWPAATWSAPELVALFFMPFGIVSFLELVVVVFAGVRGDAAGFILTVSQQVAMALPVVWWLRASGHGGWPSIGRGRHRWVRGDVIAGFGLGFGAMFAGAIVLGITYAIARAVLGREPEVFGGDGFADGWLIPLAVVAIALAPICEEILFRGVLFNGLRRSMSFRLAAAISATAFAMLHAEPIRLPSLIVVGVILAAGVERRHTLITSMAAHATVNVAAVVATFAAR